MAMTNSKRKAFLQHQGLSKHLMEVLAINWKKKRQWICFSLFPSYPHPLPSMSYPNRWLAMERTGWGTAEGAAAQVPPLPRPVGSRAPHGTPCSPHKGFGSPAHICKILCRLTLTFHISSHFLSFPLYENSTSVVSVSCIRKFLEGI